MPAYKYQKKCRLPRCGQEFQTNREWQEFCEPDHQIEFQKLLRRHREDVVVELELLKIEVEKSTKAFEEFMVEYRRLEDRLRASIDID